MASKADLRAEGKVLSALMSAAKKSPHSFAMLSGKNGPVLEAHKSKSVAAMKTAAKSAGGGAKGAWGTMTVAANLVTFECEDSPPSTFLKDAKKYFADRGVTTKFEIRMVGEQAAPEPEPEENKPTAKEKADAAARKKAESKKEADDDAKAKKPASEAAAKDAGDDGKRSRSDDAGGAPEAVPEPGTDAAPGGPAALDRPRADDGDDDGEEEEPVIGDDIAATVRIARKRVMNFAWMIGDGALILRAHKRRPVKALVKAARAAGAKPRGAWGTMEANGKKIILTCENTPPASAIRKLAKRQFQEMGLSYKVILAAPDATFEFGDDDGGQDSATPGTAELPRKELMAAYSAAYPGVKARIEAAGDPQEGSRLTALLGDFQTALRGGDMAAATRAVRALDNADETAASGDDPDDPPQAAQDTMVIRVMPMAQADAAT